MYQEDDGLSEQRVVRSEEPSAPTEASGWELQWLFFTRHLLLDTDYLTENSGWDFEGPCAFGE